MTLNTQFHVDTQFITSDLLLSMDQFSKRVLKPKIATIANRIDFDGLTMAQINTANIVGTGGTLPTTLTPFLSAGAMLDTEGVPRDGERCMVLDQFTQASMVGSLTGLFNPQIAISEQYKKGLMARMTVGFDWYMDQNVTSHTFATTTGTPQYDNTITSSAIVSSGWADGGTLGIKGLTANTGTLNVGDVISIANVNMVNPQNRAKVNQVRYFVVRPFSGTPSNGTFATYVDPVTGGTTGGTYTADGAGKMQVQVSTAIITGGQFQNVDSVPAASANITFYASNKIGPQSIAFHKDAFTLVSADLPLPGGVDMAARAAHKDIGVSMRVVRQYTINNDALPTRIDVLYGWASLYREFACRVTG